MKQIIDEIYTLLLEQKEVQERLLIFAEKKREAVIQSNTDELTSIVGEEYQLLSRMNAIEMQRLKITAGASEITGKKAKDITISDLLEYADERQKPLLGALQKELMDIMFKLKAQNSENKSLVEMQLEYTDIMLTAIAGSDDPLNNFYGEDGQNFDAQISRGRTIIDTEI